MEVEKEPFEKLESRKQDGIDLITSENSDTESLLNSYLCQRWDFWEARSVLKINGCEF